MKLDSPEFSRLLDPGAVAVLVGSTDPGGIGGQPLRLLTGHGFAGKVYPVSPQYTELDGIACYPDLASVPKPCDVAIVALPARQVPAAIEQCGQAGVAFAIVFAAGFREIGGAGVELEQELKAAIAASRVRVVGPNCMGIVNVPRRACMGFGPGLLDPGLRQGPVAFVSQSGGVAASVVAFASAQGIGFRYIVSSGNETDLDTLDFVDHFLDRDDVEVVVSYLEGIADGRRLRAIGRKALEKRKPVLVCKAGNSGIGRRAAGAHTASMTADYALYRAAFHQGGFVEIHDADDLADCARAFLGRKLPRGNRVAMLTTSGGAGVLMADRCDQAGLVLPPLQPGTLERLRAIMPAFSSLANPLDFTAELSGNYALFNEGLRIVLDDPNADQVIVRYGTVQGGSSQSWARDLAQACASTGKPVLAVWGGAPDPDAESAAILAEHRIPWSLTPMRAAYAAGVLHQFAARIASLRAPNRVRPLGRVAFDLPSGEGPLDAELCKRLLLAYGIPCADEAVAAATASGLECVVGAVCDRYFGPVVTLRVGGVATELVEDVAYRFAPFDAQSGREMVDELRLAPLFKGYRHRPALDLAALADLLSRLSWLIADHADRIAQIDLNPLFVQPEGQGAITAGARIAVHASTTH
jgi:acyl-CoA synthetase (NDP forming)